MKNFSTSDHVPRCRKRQLTGGWSANNFSNPITVHVRRDQAASTAGRSEQAIGEALRAVPSTDHQDSQFNFPPLDSIRSPGPPNRPNELTYSADWMRRITYRRNRPPAASAAGRRWPAQAPLPAEQDAATIPATTVCPIDGYRREVPRDD